MPTDRVHLAAAARLALRGHGRAEPNPLVGCVIVAADGRRVGWGYHPVCGGPHAEIEALRRAGPAAAGAIAYVTLEPCAHDGRTGPCVKALLDAGISRVVTARRDPHSDAGGGLERLREAGVEVAIAGSVEPAVRVSDPFVHRVTTGLPWVIAKWAQTLDGRIATRTGESQFISSVSSRRLVHRERGRMCAILTGIGTVLADDPLLTARGVRVRRRARRIVIDPRLETPVTARLVTTARETPTTIVTRRAAAPERARELEQAGVEIIGADDEEDGAICLEGSLREISRRHDVTNVLVEGGAGLLGRLFASGLVNEAWVFIAPLLFADTDALPCARGRTVRSLTDGIRLETVSRRERGGDVVLRYRVAPAPSRSGPTASES